MAVADKSASVEEGVPLIAEKTGASTPKFVRKWRNSWLMLFGDGSPGDVAACCLTYHAPFVSFGWNQARGMQLSFWREMLRFILFTIGSFSVVHLVSCLTMMVACPPPEGMHGPHKMGHHDFTDTDTDTDKTDSDWETGHGPKHFHHGPEMSDECMRRATPGLLAAIALGIALAVYFVYFAARRRQALRERFAIEGSFKEDVALWACCSLCALTQETRTLMHEQVHEGIWHGPHGSVQAVPNHQVMV